MWLSKALSGAPFKKHGKCASSKNAGPPPPVIISALLVETASPEDLSPRKACAKAETDEAVPPEYQQTAAARAYGNIDVRSSIFAQISREDVTKILTLDRAMFPNMVRKMYHQIPLGAATASHFNAPKGSDKEKEEGLENCDRVELYRSSVQEVDCSPLVGSDDSVMIKTPEKITKELVAELRERFPGLKTIRFDRTVNADGCCNEFCTSIEVGPDGPVAVRSSNRVMIDLQRAGHFAIKIGNYMPAVLQGVPLTVDVYAAFVAREADKTNVDLARKWLLGPKGLPKTVSRLDLEELPFELHQLTQICRSRTGVKRPLRTIRAFNLAPFDISDFETFIKAAGPQLECLELICKSTIESGLSLLDLPKVADILRFQCPVLHCVHLHLSHDSPEGERIVDSEIFMGRAGINGTAQNVSLYLTGKGKPALPELSIGRILACIARRGATCRVGKQLTTTRLYGQATAPCGYPGWQNMESNSNIQRFVDHIHALPDTAQDWLRNIHFEHYDVFTVGHAMRVEYNIGGQPRPRLLPFFRELGPKCDWAEDKSVKLMEALEYYLPLEEKFIAHQKARKNKTNEPDPECELAASQLMCFDRPVREAIREVIQALEAMDEGIKKVALGVDDIRERKEKKAELRKRRVAMKDKLKEIEKRGPFYSDADEAPKSE